MKKIIFVLGLLFFSNFVAGSNHIRAIISGEDPNPNERDPIFIGCDDLSFNDCNPTMWYYLTESSSCSNVKSDYTLSITDQRPDDGVGEFINIECEDDQYNYLCLWVEEGDNMPPDTDFKISKQLMVDCTDPVCSIIRPTSGEPYLGKFLTDSAEVEFTIIEESIESYELKVHNSQINETLCEITGTPLSDGTFTETCQWADKSNGFYDVDVTVRDKLQRRKTCAQSGAIEISQNVPPVFRDFTLRLFGLNPEIDDAFNLNDLVYDEQDELSFQLDGVSCVLDGQQTEPSEIFDFFTGTQEEIRFDESENLDIGSVKINPQTTGECEVSLTATETSSDEGFSTDGNFTISIASTGYIEFRVKKQNEREWSDADSSSESLFVQSLPGEDVELDVEIFNNISQDFLTKPADIYFVMDATGSFKDELKLLEDSIQTINTNLNNAYQHADCYQTNSCIRFGIVIFGGEWCTDWDSDNEVCIGGWIPNTPENTGEWRSYATTGLVGYEDVRKTIQRVRPLLHGLKEPWFDLSFHAISELDWKDDAEKLLIIFTDAPSNGDYELQWDNGKMPNKYFNPLPQGHADLIEIADSKNVITNAIYSTVYCEKIFEGKCAGAVQLGDPVEGLCVQTGGVCIPYEEADFDDFSNKLSDIVRGENEDETIVITKIPGYDDDTGWFDSANQTTFVINNQENETVPWVFHIPSKDQLEEDDIERLFGYQAKPDNFNLTDNIFIHLFFDEPETKANIVMPEQVFEGIKTSFDGGGSTCSDFSRPSSYDWIFSDEFGNVITSNESVARPIFPDGIEFGTDYTVTLEIICSIGERLERDNETLSFRVENLPPAPRIESTEQFTTLNNDVSFHVSHNDPAGDNDGLFRYLWDFGDGDTEEGDGSAFESQSHSWDSLGTKTVKVTVIDKDGGAGTISIPIYVTNLVDYFKVETKVVDLQVDCQTEYESLVDQSIFQLDSQITVCMKISNVSNEDAESITDNYLFDAYSKKLIYEQTSQNRILIESETSTIIGWAIGPLSSGSYLLDMSFAPLDEEKIRFNNYDRKFFTVTNSLQNPLSVPDSNPVLIVLVAFSVILLIKRR